MLTFIEYNFKCDAAEHWYVACLQILDSTECLFDEVGFDWLCELTQLTHDLRAPCSTRSFDGLSAFSVGHCLQDIEFSQLPEGLVIVFQFGECLQKVLSELHLNEYVKLKSLSFGFL